MIKTIAVSEDNVKLLNEQTMKKSASILHIVAAVVIALGLNGRTADAIAADSSQTASVSARDLKLYTGDTVRLLEGNASAVAVVELRKADGNVAIGPNTLRARSGFATAVLPDGAVLVSGGIDSSGVPVQALQEVNPQALVRQLDQSLAIARTGHSATVTIDGRVVIIGGQDESVALGSIEYFDSGTGLVTQSKSSLLHPRLGHTAQLLPSGAIVVRGGTDATGVVVTDDELLDPNSDVVMPYTEALRQLNEVQFDKESPAVAEIIPPYEARNVRVDEYIGVRFSRAPAATTVNSDSMTLYGPDGVVASSVVPAQDGMLAFVVPWQNLLPGAKYSLFVQGLIDGNGASFPLMISSFTTAKRVAPVVGPSADPVVGAIDLSSDPRFVHPLAKLTWPVPTASSDPEIWSPDRDAIASGAWNDKRATGKRTVTLPTAQDGATALAGQVVKLTGEPLSGVTVKIGSVKTTTDVDGTFLLEGVAAGYSVLDINGASASHGETRYGRHLARVKVEQGKTTALPFTIWMPKIDPRGTIQISSPTTEEIVATTPAIPGLEVHIPAGTVIRDLDGKIVTEINVTAIPINRPPFPLPDLNIPVFFSVQPGGAWIQSIAARAPKGAQIHYPNYHKSLPGSRASFFNYDPYSRDWFVYGEGQTSADGKHVVPDPGVAVYQFTGAMFDSDPGGPPSGPPPGGGDSSGSSSSSSSDGGGPGAGGGGKDGAGGDAEPLSDSDTTDCDCCGPGSDSAADPVSLSTGYFTRTEKDFHLPDVQPLILTRTYRSQDTAQRTFGIGWVTMYDTILYSQNQWQEVDVILPNGGRAHFVRTSSGTDYETAIFGSTAPGMWYGAQIFRNNPRAGWDLVFRNGTKWFFPQFQPLHEIVSPNGNTVTIRRRDSNGLGGPITHIESPNGRYIDFTLDSAGRVTQAKDNFGRVYSYVYDATGRLSRAIDPMSTEHNYTYDASNRLLTATDSRGITVTSNSYDANGRLSQQTLADGNTFSFVYTVSNGKITQTEVTDQRGKVRHVEFNASGYITKSIAAYGTADAQETIFGLDTNGQVLSITDALGRVTQMTYDGFGNRTSVTRLYGTPNAVTTNYSYTPGGGYLASVTDPLGHATTLGRDSRGNVISVTDALGHATTFARDVQGRITAKTNALNHTWSYGYTGADLAAGADPLGRAIIRGTDSAGRTTTVRDHLGRTWQYGFDPRNRLTSATDPNGRIVAFGYDAHGKLTTHTDQNGNATTFTYNNLSGRTSKRDALLNTETYEYGANGRIYKITDRKGQVTGISFDNLNRVSQVGFGATVANPTSFVSTIVYTYDAGNRLTQIVDSVGGTITRTYDGLNRLTLEQTPEGSISYTYDNAGRRATMTVSGQPTITYTYDNANRLIQITRGAETTLFTYDNANRRSTTTLPNGLVTTYGYDDASQLTSITYTNGAITIGNLTYTYDLAGRRTSVGGSLASVILPAATSVATVNANNQVTSWDGVALTYDLNGNLTSDGSHSYVWNERNRLISISGATTANFLYDAFGRRRSKTVSSAQVGFLYDGANFVQQLNGTTVAANVIAGGIDEFFGRAEGSTASYPITDALGSVIGITNSSAALQTQYSYEPYGNVATTGASSTNTQKYTGREDDGTGLYFYRARYYIPKLARFASEDPLGVVAGPNSYAYVSGNPVGYTDPSGMTQRDLEELIRLARRMNPDMTIPDMSMEPLPDYMGKKTAGETGPWPWSGSSVNSDLYGGDLSPPQRVDLYDTIIHEAWHQGQPFYSRTSKQSDEEAEREAARRTGEARPAIMCGCYR